MGHQAKCKYEKMPLPLNVIRKKVLCSAEKVSVMWAEQNSSSSAEQFGQNERLVGHYRPIQISNSSGNSKMDDFSNFCGLLRIYEL